MKRPATDLINGENYSLNDYTSSLSKIVVKHW